MISIDEALDRAFWHIKVPSMTVLVGPMLLFVVLGKLGYIPSLGNEGFMWFGPTFFICILGSWLIWSIQVPRWRLWAYKRVKDISELKEEAEYAQLIWPEGSFFQKTEIASKRVWKQIKWLESENKKNT